MPCSVLVAARSSEGRAPLLSHSFDTPGGVDFRLVRVPSAAASSTAPSQRPIFRYEEERLPRFCGGARGPIAAYDEEEGGDPEPERIGQLPPYDGPTYGYWEAASGIANTCGLMIAECTCSAVFGALPRGSAGGQALLGYMELTRIALERCATARSAVQLMGGLAVEHGFYGNTTELPGAAESLVVIDTSEAWVFHILADDSGASAIWAAQQLPTGHFAAVCNMFVIREMDLADGENFCCSASCTEVAQRLGLWRPGTPLDFAAVYSAGEARHRYYSGRRVWRALSLVAPSLQLPPEYVDLLCGVQPPLPFSVVPDKPIGRTDFFSIMRDTYGGTEFDLSQQPAAGPFGITDRYDGAATCLEGGAFERPIGVYRMAYSYVGEAVTDEPLFFFGPHCAQTGVYFPILCSMSAAPGAVGTGTVKALDRGCAYWAFRRVKHTALMRWDLCLKQIQDRQSLWETKALTLVDDGSMCTEAKADELVKLATAATADWWRLDDELTVRFGDGYEHTVDLANGSLTRTPLAYPPGWLQSVNFVSSAPPPTTLWTIDRKLEQRQRQQQ